LIRNWLIKRRLPKLTRQSAKKIKQKLMIKDRIKKRNRISGTKPAMI